jgi:predicted AAA+ superfamily ATPase
MEKRFFRPTGTVLANRLTERPRRIQIVIGPRQVGKTTMVRDLIEPRLRESSKSAIYDSADPGDLPLSTSSSDWTETDRPARSASAARDRAWLVDVWQRAMASAARRHRSRERDGSPDRVPLPFVVAIDEIQKVPGWSEIVKGLWDANVASDDPLHLILLGSSALLLQRGLTESLAGRYELIEMRHWSFGEMSEAFELTLDEYMYFGGYPGAIDLAGDHDRWRSYVRSSLVEPNVAKDIVQMTRVDRPALLRRLLDLGCEYSGQVVALKTIARTLPEAGDAAKAGKTNKDGHIVTLTRYLDLLERAGLLTSLQKFASQKIRQRKSPPKFQVLNTALMTSRSTYSLAEAKADRSYWGRLVESAVGAHLCNSSDAGTRIHYWREEPLEVDFVIERGARLAALEVKSGKVPHATPGLDEFCRRHPHCRRWVVGSAELSVGEFLRYPAQHWVE